MHKRQNRKEKKAADIDVMTTPLLDWKKQPLEKINYIVK